MDEFLRPADLKRRRTSCVSNLSAHLNDNRSCPPMANFMSGNRKSISSVAQSPMKCLNNLTDPSPTKKLPTLMRNPFNQPVKRRLQLGNSPMKRSAGNESTSSSPRKSPVKKSSRMFEMNDEDANLEPPRMKHMLRNSPTKRQASGNACPQINWILKTKLKIDFQSKCNNWSQSSSTTHKRHSGNLLDEDTPSKVNDKTISLEAIKNAATVYQHPYLSWLPLFPRMMRDKTFVANKDAEKKYAQMAVSKHPAATKAMFKAWCESLDDLTNLLIDGKCPYFYICSDFNTMLIRRATGYHDAQAFITPFNFQLGANLTKDGIKFREEDLRTNNENTNSSSCNSQVFANFAASAANNNTSSQSNFNLSRTRMSALQDDDDDYDDDGSDEDLDVEEDGETSQAFFESIGVNDLSDQLKPVKKESMTSNKYKSFGIIEGVENIKRLSLFLQKSRAFVINNTGEFSSIPPTLISPREFRLSTPQYPEVNVSSAGPRTVELKGTIMPSVYRKLHKLLTVSDNMDHVCSGSELDSSTPFDRLAFPA